MTMASDLADDPRWRPWPEPEVVDSIDSTMLWLRERAIAGVPEGSAIIADRQTEGRGRHGRTWSSPAGSGVWLSILLRPEDVPPSDLGVLPLLVGVALADRLADVTQVPIAVKWPNDLVVVREGEVRKLAGLLAERLPDGAIVIGVGLNVEPFDEGLPPGATTLREEVERVSVSSVGGAAFGREDAAREAFVAVASAARAWLAGARDLDGYRSRCVTLGKQVTVTALAGADPWQGRAVDVDRSGCLLVEIPSGDVIAVSAGDVTLRRPIEPTVSTE